MNTSQFKQFLTRKNIGISLLFVVIIITVALTQAGEKKLEEPQPEADQPLAEKVCPPLASGRQVYNSLTGANPNPRILQVEFDPHDAGEGEAQEIIVKVLNKDVASVTDKDKVEVAYYTDNQTETISLAMARVEEPGNAASENGLDLSMADDNDLLTTWRGIWTSDDTRCSIHMASITAVNAKGESKVDVSFR